MFYNRPKTPIIAPIRPPTRYEVFRCLKNYIRHALSRAAWMWDSLIWIIRETSPSTVPNTPQTIW